MNRNETGSPGHDGRLSLSSVLGALMVSAFAVVTSGSVAVSADLSADTRVVDFSIADESPPGGWEFSVTPYAWLVGVSGQVKSGGRTFDIDASFYDIMSKSDYVIPLMGYAEARNGRWSIFADAFYTQMEFGKSTVVQRNVGADASLSLTGKASVVQTLAFAEAGAAYEVARWEQGPMGGSTAFDVLAGARYWYGSTHAKVKVTSNLDLPRLGLTKKGKYAVSKSGDLDWVDPVIGMRVRQDIGANGELQLLGDIAGFGVGSEFSWQIFAGYNHDFHFGQTAMGAMIGYRAIGVDYKTGSGSNARTLDLVLHGPIAGLQFKW